SAPWQANINKLCERCGFKVKRILLRPFLDTLVVAEHRQLSEGVNLLVHRVGETVDLTLTQQGRVLLSRSVLLAGHDETELDRETAQEIRRTVLTAPRIGEGRAVDRVLLIGPESDMARIREWMAELGDVELAACDPLSDNKISFGRGFANIERPEQFAAHFGALQSLAGSRVPQIDFANPRRRVERKLDKRRMILYAALAALVVIGGGIAIWQTLASQKRTITQLQKEFDDLRAENKGDGFRPGVDDVIGEVQLVDQWMAGKVDWVEQLHEFSRRLMTADQTILESFTGLLLRNQEMKISISGHLDSRESGFSIQESLAAPGRRIVPGKLALESKVPDYPFSYALDLFTELSDFETAQAVNERILDSAQNWGTSGEQAAEGQSTETPALPAPTDKE
ncbi:MAG TPA: hypothetical protein PKD54_14215, partial [Pirellulaceae bacterium]|nr:hypothetical protein [Pirellulaceae bacterium]